MGMSEEVYPLSMMLNSYIFHILISSNMFKLFLSNNFEHITYCPMIWGCASHWPAVQGLRARCMVRVVQNDALKCMVVYKLVV